MKRITCLLVLFLGLFSFAKAQTVQVKGSVTDSSGAGLPGVSIVVKDTKKGTQTDSKGNFSITVTAPSGKVTLVFSYTNFKPQTITTDGKSAVNVVLESNVTQIEDVVVIGYQTVRRKDLLASVASVGAKELKDVPVNNAAEALNGRLAGVTATTTEGSPDAEVRVRIRGGMSITGSNDPLYIIDGVQVESGLSSISPQDIQTIDVLKDAAATAIYGARGANGVVIITTKSGKPGRTVVSYNGFVGIRSIARKLDVLSPYDFVIYQAERSRLVGGADSTGFLNSYGTTWDTLNVYKNFDAVDWQSEAFGRTGVNQTHNVSASGGGKKITFNFGYTYNRDKAIVLNSLYNRHLVNFKTNYKVTKKLSVGVSTRFSNLNVYGAGVSADGNTSVSRLRNAIRYRPYISNSQDIEDFSDPTVNSVTNGLSLVNPIQLANAEYRRKTTDAFNITANAQYTILKRLVFKTTLGLDWNDRIDRQFADTLSPQARSIGNPSGVRPVATLDTVKSRTITNSNVLTYSTKIKNHNFDFMVGQETFEVRTERHTTQLRNFPLDINSDFAFKNQSAGVTVTGFPRAYEARSTQLSFFGRIGYNYKDKYLMSANLRRDGSSKFSTDNRWGTFPAASLAWRIKKENFLKNVDFINDLKLRFGFGTMGNNRISDYLYLNSFAADGSRFYGLNGQVVTAYVPTSLPNELLRWEATVNRNWGLDLSVLKNRLSLSFDYYINNSKDLLLNVDIDPTYGFSSQIQNVGETKNKGWELQVNATIFNKPGGFNWTANFNISHNNNSVVSLGSGQLQKGQNAYGPFGGQDYLLRVGETVGVMYGLVTDGFYTTNDFVYNSTTMEYTLKPGVVENTAIIGSPIRPGSIKYRDLNGDGKVDLNNDTKIIGNPNPKFTGGLSQSFSYKNWDMSLFVNFMYDFDVYNANRLEFTNAYSTNSNMLAVMKDRWRNVDPATGESLLWLSNGKVYGVAPDRLASVNSGATMWQPLITTGAFTPHSWAIEDGSFLRFNNLTVGYTLPVKKVTSLHMSKLRFYFTANNFAIITNYSGYDPEVSVRSDARTPNFDYSPYPKSRNYIFGINATF